MTNGKTVRRGLFQGAALVVALAVVGFTFRDIELERVLDLVQALGPEGLLLALVPAVVATLLETTGWRVAFSMFGERPRFVALLWVRLVTEAFVLTIPAGAVVAEPAKVPLLVQHARVDAGSAVAGTLARKYLLLSGQALWIGVAAIAGLLAFPMLNSTGIGSALVGLLVAAFVALGLAALFVRALLSRGTAAGRVRAWLLKLPFQMIRRKVLSSEQAFANTDGRLSTFFAAPPGREALVTLLYVAAWAAETAETYLLLRLLGADLSFGAVAAMEVALTLLRNIAFVLPAGVGLQDVGYALLLRAFGVVDAPELSLAFSLLKRGKEIAFALLGFSLLGTARATTITDSNKIGSRLPAT